MTETPFGFGDEDWLTAGDEPPESEPTPTGLPHSGPAFDTLVAEIVAGALLAIESGDVPANLPRVAVEDAARREISRRYDGPKREYPHRAQNRAIEAAFPRVHRTVTRCNRDDAPGGRR